MLAKTSGNVYMFELIARHSTHCTHTAKLYARVVTVTPIRAVRCGHAYTQEFVCMVSHGSGSSHISSPLSTPSKKRLQSTSPAHDGADAEDGAHHCGGASRLRGRRQSANLNQAACNNAGAANHGSGGSSKEHALQHGLRCKSKG